MKTKRLLLGGLLLAGLLAIVAASVFGIHALISVSGISLAMAGAVGTPVADTATMQNTDTANPNILDKEVVKKIVEIRPSATPLDTILNNISGKKETKSFEVEYFSGGVRDKVTTVKTAVAATSGSSPLTQLVTVAMDNTIFADTHDVLMFPEITDTSDGQPLTAHVFKRDTAAGTVNLMFINGKGTNQRDIPAIPAGTKMVRIGKAMDERAARCDDFYTVPENDSNYCQIFMTTITEGFYEKIVAKRVDFDLTEIKDSAIYDFKRQKEGASLFGKKAKLISPENGLIYYHTEGIATTIGKNKSISFKSSDSLRDTITDWTRAIFTGNNGADTRYAFVGDDIIAWLIKNADIKKYMDAKATEMVHGIRFNKMETNFGTLLFKAHPDFKAYGYDRKMLVFDPEYIDLRHLRPMNTRVIDNEKNGSERSKSYVMDEVFCPIVTNPDVHALITMTE